MLRSRITETSLTEGTRCASLYVLLLALFSAAVSPSTQAEKSGKVDFRLDWSMPGLSSAFLLAAKRVLQGRGLEVDIKRVRFQQPSIGRREHDRLDLR